MKKRYDFTWLKNIIKQKIKVNKAQVEYDKAKIELERQISRGITPEKELKYRSKLLKLNSKLIDAQTKLKNTEIDLERLK